jgi:hypothetical protein
MWINRKVFEDIKARVELLEKVNRERQSDLLKHLGLYLLYEPPKVQGSSLTVIAEKAPDHAPEGKAAKV